MRRLTQALTQRGDNIVLQLPNEISSAACDGIEALASAAALRRVPVGLTPSERHLEGITAYAETLNRRTPSQPVRIQVASPTRVHHAIQDQHLVVALPCVTDDDQWSELVETFGSTRSALRPGGYLAVVTPCASALPFDEIVTPVARILKLCPVARYLTVHLDPVTDVLVGHACVRVFATPEADGV